MDIVTRSFETPNGLVEGVQVRWEGFGILMVTGKEGFLVCGVFDLDAIGSFGAAAAIVESTPENPIGTLERFPLRTIMKVNAKARGLGITAGMSVPQAFALIA